MTSGSRCGYMDISPNFSFAMNSIGNTCGSIAGILGPLIVAAFLTSYPGILTVLSICIYVLFILFIDCYCRYLGMASFLLDGSGCLDDCAIVLVFVFLLLSHSQAQHTNRQEIPSRVV